ncbi:CoxG family protein [Maribacter algicola]|uniref:CoxG family protein n=1 Tax=Meishania litoralis TaxID=3434685 RepID=A0ACC7LLD6_9FLAO
MKINGTYKLNAAPDVVWKMLMDPTVLEKVTPGVKQLKPLGEDAYNAISEVRIGPVKGTFEGNLSVRDKVTEKSCLLVIDQKSKSGNVVAEIGMQFNALDDGKTEVKYTGEAKMSGMLARMGQRIMSGVVSTLSKQFFQAFENELEKNGA